MITKGDIIEALRSAGLTAGMTVFSHANIAFFGPVAGAANMSELIDIMLAAFKSVLGPDGTLVLPVFTYSFSSDKQDGIFDLQKSVSTTSGLGNWLIANGMGCRSADPMLSVVALGGLADSLTRDIDPICFGPRSIWARLHEADATICNLNLDSGSTYLHWVERELGVAYRSDIPMMGTIIDHGRPRATKIVYTGRSLADPNAVPKFEHYHNASVAAGLSKIVPLGRGQIVAQSCRKARDFLGELLERNPYILTARHEKLVV
ncbi:AAC(3) family N-acetyltransferase [Rhizobium leguminosarum]